MRRGKEGVWSGPGGGRWGLGTEPEGGSWAELALGVGEREELPWGWSGEGCAGDRWEGLGWMGGALPPSLGAVGRGAMCAVACLRQSTGSRGEIGRWERPESTRVAAGLRLGALARGDRKSVV